MDPTNQVDTTIPEAFRRPVTNKASNGVTLATPSAPAKAKSAKPRTVKASAKPAPKAKVAKAHKPSTIVRTADNPIRSIVPAAFKARYSEHNDTCGKPLNLALKAATTTKNAEGREALDIPALKAVAKANGIDFSPYEKLNNGQKRMNVGNKLAGLVKAGTTVVIGKQKFADAKKALKAPADVQASA